MRGFILLALLLATMYEFKRSGRQWVSYLLGAATIAFLPSLATQLNQGVTSAATGVANMLANIG